MDRPGEPPERRGRDRRGGGVLPTPRGPFPYSVDQIAARDRIIKALYEQCGTPEIAAVALDPDHCELLRSIVVPDDAVA